MYRRSSTALRLVSSEKVKPQGWEEHPIVKYKSKPEEKLDGEENEETIEYLAEY
jgi:hypothetical protein